MTKILIASPGCDVNHAEVNIVIITGDYGASPVKAMMRAKAEFEKPVVLIVGRSELDGDSLSRLLSEGRRLSRKWATLHFLERSTAIIADVRFIGMHDPDLDFIQRALKDPHVGPSVIVTYKAPPEDISAVTSTGKVSRWIHAATTSFEPLVVEVWPPYVAVMSIASPKQASDHPDRVIDCEFAMEPEFQALAHRAEAAGWTSDDVSTAMMNLAVAQIKAIVAEQRTAADVRLAMQLIRTMKGEPKSRER